MQREGDLTNKIDESDVKQQESPEEKAEVLDSQRKLGSARRLEGLEGAQSAEDQKPEASAEEA